MTNRPESGAGPPDYDSQPFAVWVRTDGPSTLAVEVRGELDLATAPVLKQNLEPYSGRPKRIVYQLSDLAFIDATGLSALLTAVDGHDPTTITVRDPSPMVRRLLELVGLDLMIENANDGTKP